MLCCEEVKQSVPDLASGLKQAALKDTRKKNVLANCYILTRCANPYAIGDIVLTNDQRTISVFHCGDLVFRVINYDLKKYICGDWSEKLAAEVKRLKARQSGVRARNQVQLFKNTAAEKNYQLSCNESQ
ncbi:MAG: hypothetical protein ACYSQZ_08525 [Planctomycetota bacterium]|jgi:hypothetical protein